MSLENLIRKRRAYRALKPIQITKEIIEQAATLSQLAPSCMNKQPWRFIFVHEPEALKDLLKALSRGNQVWNQNASMIIAVFSKPDLDCVIGPNKERTYYQFDTGMATAFLILYLTELDLVAHPMAGFDPTRAKEILNIPEDMELITLIGVGKKTDIIPEDFSEHQKKTEIERPKRNPLSDFVFLNKYKEE
ncbi:MAG: nitroreductase family protein [Candidatus Hodarchaeota archaeon]